MVWTLSMTLRRLVVTGFCDGEFFGATADLACNADLDPSRLGQREP